MRNWKGAGYVLVMLGGLFTGVVGLELRDWALSPHNHYTRSLHGGCDQCGKDLKAFTVNVMNEAFAEARKASQPAQKKPAGPPAPEKKEATK